MSSMRNAVQRRNHKERSQPEERKKLGLLEKHKDYSARALDYNTKKRKLASLRQKVLEKNPDEFYFGMLSRKGVALGVGNKGKATGTVDGVREAEVLSQEAVRLFKTQDAGYVRTMGNQVRKEVETLERRVSGIKAGLGARGEGEGRGKGMGKKVVFCEDEREVSRRLGEGMDGGVGDDEDEDEDEDEEEGKPEFNIEERNIRRVQRKELAKLENKLGIAREKLKALTQAEEALDFQRAKMSKTPTVGGVTKEGVKFKVRGRKR